MAKPKVHPKPAPTESKIVRNKRGREHIENCNDGYYQTTEKYMQVHHIICVSSMTDGTISDSLKNDDAFTFIKNCLNETNWNVNDAHNTVGLPLKRAFVDKRAPAKWNGLPCHQVDHNPYYTVNMHKDLNAKVWQPAIEVGEECSFEAKSLVTQLKARSKAWRSWLKARGSGKDPKFPMPGGTQYCWDNRLKFPATWYIPFSMHPGTPTKRAPPPDSDALKKSVQSVLKTLFQTIK